MSVEKDNILKDVFHSIIKYHADRNFLDKAVAWLFMKQHPLVIITSKDKFLSGNMIFLSLITSFSLLQTFEKKLFLRIHSKIENQINYCEKNLVIVRMISP